MDFDRQHCERKYVETLREVPQGIGTTRTNLQRLLHSLDFVGWSSNEESGRLDRRALTRFATGSANIFSRRQYIEAETSAVSVLIDCSGSMNNDGRIKVAQKIAVHLSNILQRARVPFTVNGFHQGKTVYHNESSAYTEHPTFLPFKPWNKSLQQCVAALGAINSCASGGTPDYSALANSIEDLSRRTEHRKILFVITDADGYNRKHMEHLQRLADKLGILIVAIGIQSDSVTQCFVNSASVDDISQLASTAFNQLLKTVRQKVK